MWNPEARDSSPITFTFMSSWERPKMPPLPGRRGTRRSLWKKRAAAGFELELEPWVSLWSNHFGEESTPPLAWTEGNKMPPPGRRGTRGTGATKSTSAEELALVLGEVAEKS
jgi:hypothetical protein